MTEHATSRLPLYGYCNDCEGEIYEGHPHHDCTSDWKTAPEDVSAAGPGDGSAYATCVRCGDEFLYSHVWPYYDVCPRCGHD